MEFTLKLTAAAAKRIKEMASAQALEKIRNRVDLVGRGRTGYRAPGRRAHSGATA